jgi:hypothetical protein
LIDFVRLLQNVGIGPPKSRSADARKGNVLNRSDTCPFDSVVKIKRCVQFISAIRRMSLEFYLRESWM